MGDLQSCQNIFSQKELDDIILKELVSGEPFAEPDIIPCMQTKDADSYRRYICSFCSQLQFADKREILKILVNYGFKKLIHESGANCAVDLDKVPDEICIKIGKLAELRFITR
jgi:hypothetical protein